MISVVFGSMYVLVQGAVPSPGLEWPRMSGRGLPCVVCVCIYIYIYITCIYIYVYIYICTYIYTCVYVYIYIYIHIRYYYMISFDSITYYSNITYIYIYIYIYIYTCIYIHVWSALFRVVSRMRACPCHSRLLPRSWALWPGKVLVIRDVVGSLCKTDPLSRHPCPSIFHKSAIWVRTPSPAGPSHGEVGCKGPFVTWLG